MDFLLRCFKVIAGVLAAGIWFSMASGNQGKAKPVGSDGGPNMELWKKCSDDGDCIVIAGICQHPLAINKKYKSEAENYIYWQNAKRKCPDNIEEMTELINRSTAFCENGVGQVRFEEESNSNRGKR